MPLSAGVHYYNSSYWVDGVQQSPISEWDSWGTVRKDLLFCYQHENSYPFNGDVYAFRIYGRALTDAELLHNWTLDQQRFNIGA